MFNSSHVTFCNILTFLLHIFQVKDFELNQVQLCPICCNIICNIFPLSTCLGKSSGLICTFVIVFNVVAVQTVQHFFLKPTSLKNAHLNIIKETETWNNIQYLLICFFTLFCINMFSSLISSVVFTKTQTGRFFYKQKILKSIKMCNFKSFPTVSLVISYSLLTLGFGSLLKGNTAAEVSLMTVITTARKTILTPKSCVTQCFSCSVVHLKEFVCNEETRKRGLEVGVVLPLSISCWAEVE